MKCHLGQAELWLHCVFLRASIEAGGGLGATGRALHYGFKWRIKYKVAYSNKKVNHVQLHCLFAHVRPIGL